MRIITGIFSETGNSSSSVAKISNVFFGIVKKAYEDSNDHIGLFYAVCEIIKCMSLHKREVRNKKSGRRFR